MRPWSAAWRATSIGVAGLLGAAALVAGLGAAPAAAAPAIPAATSTAATSAGHFYQTPQQASAQAIRTGEKVPVTGSTTPDSTLTANPDGTFTLTESTAPVRTKVGGTWRNLDASLVRNADGTYSPAVSSEPLALSGGGTGPLATMTYGTYSLAVTAPMRLPAPVITGNTASYDSVLPGVDLIVTAQPSDGFSEVLRIATAKAAANPALRALTFTTTTKGVTLKTAGNGAITADTRTGQAIFAAPAPQMWDSANTPAGTQANRAADSTASGPGAGAHMGRLGVNLAGGQITLTPDRQLLTGPGAVYPEYLDPTWDAAGSAASTWAYVSQQFPTTDYYDTDMTLQVGQDPDATSYTSYSFYTLPVPSQIYGAVIDTAYAYFPEVWADSCTASPVQAWLTGAIGKSTTWDNQPAWESELGSDNVAYGWSPSGNAGGKPPNGDPGCGDNDVAFTVTSAVATGAADGWPGVTVGLKASDTSDATGWKQFADPDSTPSGNATMSITYANAPATPVLSTSPAANCTTGTSVLGNGAVNLDAAVYDKNGTATGSLTVDYNVYADGNENDNVDSSSPPLPAASGTPAVFLLPVTALDSAVTKYGNTNPQVSITWTATVSDGLPGVPSSTASCTFIFSTAIPGAPQIFDANNQTCGTPPTAGGASYTVGKAASFTLDPNGTSTAATEPTSYIYQLNGGNPVTVAASSSSPYSATISVTPAGFTNILTVEATAAGGNIGQAASCPITAGPPVPAVDQDLSGDGIPDLLTVGNGTNGLPQGLWLADGQPGSNGFDGTVDTTATDIARIGPQDTGPNSWTGMKVITGEFTDSGFNDVEAYNPANGDVYILKGNGNGTIDTSQGQNLTLWDTNYAGTGTTIYPQQLVNAYQVSCDNQSPCIQYPDEIGVFDDSGKGGAGAYLGYFQNTNGAGNFDGGNCLGLPYELANTSPDGMMDWTDWTITTSNDSTGGTGPTNMWLWNKTTGALYLWQLTGLTHESSGSLIVNFSTGQSICAPNPTATLSYTQTEISADWNEAATLDTLQATEINGQPGLITVNGSGQVQSWYLDNGTTLTQAGSTQQLLTADHTYLLDQGSSGTVSTAADQPGAGDTEQDLAAPANNTGTTWNTSDPVYSPDVAFNGSNTSYLASSGPTFNPSTSFTISAWVNPSALGGTVFSQDGTDDSSIKVSSTTTDHWSVGANTGGTTADTYASMPGGTVQLGMWTNLTLTYDTASSLDLLDLYVNGAEVASLYATLPVTTGPFVLGASQTGASSYGSYFSGQLADVQVWDSLFIPPSTVVGVSGAPAAFDVLNGNQDLYAAATNGTEYEDSLIPSSGVWTGWQNLDGVLTGGTAAIYNPDSQSEQAFGVGTTDSMYVDTWTQANTWSGWQAMPGGSFTGTPAVLYDPVNATVEVYATSTSGTPEESSWISSEDKWSGWTSLGGDLASSPAAVYNPAIGGVQVFGVGTTDSLYVDTWTPASGWSSWQAMPTGDFTGTPAVLYDPASGNTEVYARSTSNVPEEDYWISYEGKWSGWNNLGGSLSTSPATIYNPATNSVQVFGVGTGTTPTVYVDTWAPGNGWSGWTNLGGALTSSPAAVYNPNTDSMEIFGIGTTGEVYEDYSTSATTWSGWTSLGSTTFSNL
jgi:hypothetical protein